MCQKVASLAVPSFGKTGEGSVASTHRKAVLCSKAMPVPRDVAGLQGTVSPTERQSNLQNGAGRYGEP